MYKTISRSVSRISFNFLPLALSRDGVDNVVSRQLAGQVGARIPAGANIFLFSKSWASFPPPPSPSLLFSGWRGYFLGVERVFSHHPLVPRLRMSGAIPLHSFICLHGAESDTAVMPRVTYIFGNILHYASRRFYIAVACNLES